jgi:diguanylate cyclase (GGDEF)-like protein/PAS domain S-box-containing protein
MHPLLADQVHRHLPPQARDSLTPFLAALDDLCTRLDTARQACDKLHNPVTCRLLIRNEELEARVADRTRDLESANQQLLRDIAHRTTIEDRLHSAERKYRSIFEGAAEGIFQTTVDGRYLACNPALARIYGYDSPEELIASVTDIARKLYVDDDSRPRFQQIMADKGSVSGFEARIYRKDGTIIWITESARAVRNAEGMLLHYEGFVSDITARKIAEESLRESEERYVLAVRGANDGLWDWNLRTGLIHFSARWKQMLGRAADEIGTTLDDWFHRVHPDDLPSLQSAIAAHRDGLTPHFEIEHRMLHADGRYRWMLSRGMAIRDPAGRAVRIAGSQTDVTLRREAEEQLLRDALHDGLTGLPNRVLFLDRLERSLSRIARDRQHTFAVLFLDLDRFKGINDSLGHEVGDQLLVAFAKRLGACLRPGDTAARLGGDEFTVLLEDPATPHDPSAVAQRILQELNSPFRLGPHEVFVSASIGIASSAVGYSRPQDVLRDADTAMYHAKARGKGRHEVFDAAMHDRAVKLLTIENDLRRALERQEFRLQYQPIVDIDSGRIKAFEALVRWDHPDLGIISPAEFIPVAEDTRLILPLGRWILFEACRQTALWHAQGAPVDINVNLSGIQFSQADLVDQVTQALHASGLPARHLILEITESVVMENPAAAVATLHRLKALGLKLNIDDFGTGYSSLAYLQRFPVDTMKIDRSFVSRLTQTEPAAAAMVDTQTEPAASARVDDSTPDALTPQIPESTSHAKNAAEIVRTIVHLAHNLNMKVTAEGIETPQQLAYLQDLHCEHAQGYLISRPLDAPAATDLLLSPAPATSPNP